MTDLHLLNNDQEEALSALSSLEPPLERGPWVQLLMAAHDAGISENDGMRPANPS